MIKATEFSLKDNRLAYLAYLCDEHKEAANNKALIEVIKIYQSLDNVYFCTFAKVYDLDELLNEE